MAKSSTSKKINPKSGFSKIDKMLDTAGWFGLATLVIITVFTYFRVPDTIPVHFNIVGRPNGFGNKLFLFAVLGIACFIFFSITLTIKYVFASPKATAIPNKNLDFAIRIVRFLKLMVMIGFIYIMVITNLIVDHVTDGLGSFFLPAVVITLLFPVAYFFKKTMREKLMKR